MSDNERVNAMTTKYILKTNFWTLRDDKKYCCVKQLSDYVHDDMLGKIISHGTEQ